jgi:hypothetical protein
LITQFLVDPNFLPRHVHRQRLRLLHLALGARFRGPPIEVQKIKEIFRAVPPESEETLAIVAESFMHDTVTGGGLRPIIDLTSVQCCR